MEDEVPPMERDDFVARVAGLARKDRMSEKARARILRALEKVQEGEGTELAEGEEQGGTPGE
jgi:hypothetical protein